jgi:hypothetical protein
MNIAGQRAQAPTSATRLIPKQLSSHVARLAPLEFLVVKPSNALFCELAMRQTQRLGLTCVGLHRWMG